MRSTDLGRVCKRCCKINNVRSHLIPASSKSVLGRGHRNRKKICPKCEVEKSFAKFGMRGGDEKRWLNSWCLLCRNKRSKEYKQEEGYRERNAAYMRKYRKDHKD